MPTLLHIDSSPLDTSISRELTREFVKDWKAAHPGSRVIERDLAANPPAPVNQPMIYAAFTPTETRTPEQIALLTESDKLTDEVEQADEYVIGVAMHNFTIPAVLKLWIDQIVRNGRTFAYGANGPAGLLKNKKATILSATGGDYQAGTPYAAANHIDPYLKTVLGFIGVADLTFITASGTAVLRTGTVDREAFLKPVLEKVSSVAV